MKNYLHKRGTETVTAPYAVSSGGGCLVGFIFGIAVADAASGAPVVLNTVDSFSVACLSTDTPAQGAKLYWDDTNKRLTTTSTSNTYVGTCLTTKLTGATVVDVRLNGSYA